jgi:predicted NAD/FAD-dependent oxidoreductase
VTVPRVAVVGAGLAGLACARALAADGAQVTVLEKSRGPGGRAATRVTARDGDGHPASDALAFDHGAQYATARDARFVGQLEAWRALGVAAEWEGRIVALAGGAVRPAGDAARPVRRWVGVPGMHAFGRALAAHAGMHGVTLARGVRVTVVQGAAGAAGARWTLGDEAGAAHGPFDAVIVAVPAPQAAPLLAAVPSLAARAAAVPMTPCWSAMLAVAEPLGLPFDGAFVNAPSRADGDGRGSLATAVLDVRADAGAADVPALAWVARDSSKPGRALPVGVAETWVLHAAPAWSAAHLECAPDVVARRLLAELAREARVPVHAPVVHLAAHRWRHATPAPALAEPALWDAHARLGACGDWCGGPRVEGAYLSGLAAAERVRAALGAAIG